MYTELFECHGHIMMDALNLGAAASRHKAGVDSAAVKSALDALSRSGVVYFRDGGDNLGVSGYARKIAHEYGIRYVTPVFAIHKEGRYGGIVGRAYGSAADYLRLIAKAKEDGADFIKLMMSGIMTFGSYGELSCPSLEPGEIKELVRAAHNEGLRVMAHVNGSDTIKAALEAGTDSIEHGYFIDGECIRLLAETKAVWVPTLSPVAAAAGFADGRGAVAGDILRRQMENIKTAFSKGAFIASGSDSGAYGVPHGAGTVNEYKLLHEASALDADSFRKRLDAANKKIRDTFVACCILEN